MHVCDPINVNVAQRTYERLFVGVPISRKDNHDFFSFSEPRNLLAVCKDKAVPSYWSGGGSKPLIRLGLHTNSCWLMD